MAVGISTGTLRRWVQRGVIPQFEGEWTPAAVGQARLIGRMRERGYSFGDIRRAVEDGRLAFGQVTELFAAEEHVYTLADASRESGLGQELVERLMLLLGLRTSRGLTEDDLEMLRYVGAVLDAGLPLDAMLQLTRVYGQALAQIADAEVRLVHLYVHEPLMRAGTSAADMGDELVLLTSDLLPLASPMLDQLHRRLLAHFIEQDVVGHMEAALEPAEAGAGRMRVAILFGDLAGYTRLTEEEGELHALDVVERFTEAVAVTLPEEARVIKTIGDEVMVVGADPVTLTEWAVGFQALQSEPPLPRIGVHYGYALYRDGDYYGREVNIAARVAARSGAGEVLVTRPIVEAVGSELDFERIAEVRLKGFKGPTELFLARPRADDER